MLSIGCEIIGNLIVLISSMERQELWMILTGLSGLLKIG
jgi:hypothetical protein